jgi:glycosyltransferase involved in cell wall biosynthesis
MRIKKLAIYGPYPPPLGGISVHIKRMEPFLKKHGIDYSIFDFGSTKKENVIPTNKSIFWYLKILFNKKYDLFHFHQIFFLNISFISSFL